MNMRWFEYVITDCWIMNVSEFYLEWYAGTSSGLSIWRTTA